MSMFEPAEVRAAAKGQRAAQERLVRKLLPRVRNLVRYLVRGDEAVDDISQNALIDLVNGLPSYRFEAPIEKWADRIVARTTFRYLKRARLQDASPLIDEPQEPSHLESQLSARREVARLLDQLPEAQRVAVALHHGAGMTVPELAELLDVSADTVKSRLRLAMAKLRKDDATERAS